MTVSWISERLQTDEGAMRRLQDAAIVPGAQIMPGSRGDLIHIITPNGQTDAEISRSTAALVYVDR